MSLSMQGQGYDENTDGFLNLNFENDTVKRINAICHICILGTGLEQLATEDNARSLLKCS